MGGGRARERTGPRPVTTHATRPTDRRTTALVAAGLAPEHAVHWNAGPAELYEHAVRRGEGVIVAGGAFCAVTTPYTGRSPNDKFIVQEPSSAADIAWGRVNQPLAPELFDRLRAAVVDHLNGQELFVRDVFAGADVNHRLALRCITPNAWQALFVYNMFLRPAAAELGTFAPPWLVLHAPEFQARPAAHGTHSGPFIAHHSAQPIIRVGGTRDASAVDEG